METEWMLDELATGLQKLLCLGLDRQPASEVIPGTVQAWHEALTEGRRWDEARDTPRIRAAFVTLATTREQWPAPRHFLDALPRHESKAIGYEVKPASREQASEAMARIRKMLDKQAPQFHVELKPEREGPPLDEVERELQQHYGKVAAAGPDA